MKGGGVAEDGLGKREREGMDWSNDILPQARAALSAAESQLMEREKEHEDTVVTWESLRQRSQKLKALKAQVLDEREGGSWASHICVDAGSALSNCNGGSGPSTVPAPTTPVRENDLHLPCSFPTTHLHPCTPLPSFRFQPAKPFRAGHGSSYCRTLPSLARTQAPTDRLDADSKQPAFKFTVCHHCPLWVSLCSAIHRVSPGLCTSLRLSLGASPTTNRQVSLHPPWSTTPFVSARFPTSATESDEREFPIIGWNIRH